MSELPTGWAKSTMLELTEYVTSGSREWSKFYSDEGALFIRTQDIKTNALCSQEHIARVSLPKKVEGKRTLVKPNDLLVTITGANVGKVAIVPESITEAYVSQSVALIRPTHWKLTEYLHCCLMAPTINGKTSLQNAAYGQGRPVLSLGDVRNTEIPLPPLPEQRRIVRKLDTLSARTTNARTHLTAIAKLVEKYKAGVLEAAFSISAPPVTVGSLIDGIKAGKNLKCDERPPRDGERGTVKVSAVSWGAFRADQSKTFPPHFEPDPDTAIKSGDFLFSRANTIELVGAVVIVGEAPGNLFLSDKVLRLDMASHFKPWLLWFLRSPQGRMQLEEISSGNQMSMRNIGQAKLKSLLLPLPEKAQRDEVLNRIETAFAKIDRLAAEADKALKLTDRLDQRILAKAFAGELVPQDPTEEPATELLARIRAARSNTPKPKRGRRKKVQV